MSMHPRSQTTVVTLSYGAVLCVCSPRHVFGERVHGHVGGGARLELHVDRLVVAHVVVALVDASPVRTALQGLFQGGLLVARMLLS